MTTTPCEQMNAKLARALVWSPKSFFVPGPQKHYRNKICYSLTPHLETPLQTSDLAMQILNEVCSLVNILAREAFLLDQKEQKENSSSSSTETNDPPPQRRERQQRAKREGAETRQQQVLFFLEVTAKITRRKEIIVKLSVQHENSESFLSSGRGLTFASRVAEKFPSVKAFVLHVAPAGGSKGTKSASASVSSASNSNSSTCATAAASSGQQEAAINEGGEEEDGGRYVPLLPNQHLHVIDETCNGVPVLLSVDAFAEVNWEMEKAMTNSAHEFLNLPHRNQQQEQEREGQKVQEDEDDEKEEERKEATMKRRDEKAPKAAVIMGRDCNFQFLQYKHVYDQNNSIMTTQCLRALADAQKMNLANKKNFVSCGKERIPDLVLSQALDRFESFDLLVTAGRNGLFECVIDAVISDKVASKVGSFLYTGCNLVSFTRDLQVLRQAYFVRSCKTFDFFPGTNYRMTMIELVPILRTQRRLLILPVSAPACGKSSSAVFLKQAFEVDPNSVAEKNKKKSNNSNNNNNNSSSSSSRVFKRRPESVSVDIFERDLVFKKEREKEKSTLNSTKLAVHQQLLSFLAQRKGRQISILDSTNGSVEQRQEYKRLWECKKDDDEKQQQQQQQQEETQGAEQQQEKERVDVREGSAHTLEVFFDPSSSSKTNQQQHESEEDGREKEVVEMLLSRCQERQNEHPAFPSGEEEGRKKIETILAAISSASSFSSNHNSQRRIPCGKETTSQQTHEGFSWLVFLAFFTDFERVGSQILLEEED